MDKGREKSLSPEGVLAHQRFLDLVKIYKKKDVFKYIEAVTNGVAESVIIEWFSGMRDPSPSIQRSIAGALQNYREGDMEELGFKKLEEQPSLEQKHKALSRLNSEQRAAISNLREHFEDQYFLIRESGFDKEMILSLARAGLLSSSLLGSTRIYKVKKLKSAN